MECAPCMKDVSKDDCIVLKKYVYRLVQATRKCNKKAVEILKMIGFTRDNVFPCLYMKQSTRDTAYIALY